MNRSRLKVLGAGLALAALAAEGWLAAGSAAMGSALAAGGGGETGFPYARRGDSAWFALPPVTNRSDRDLELLGPEVIGLPDGVELTGTAAFGRAATEPMPLALRDDSVREGGFVDRSGTPERLAPGQEGRRSLMVRLTLTGDAPVRVEGCRVVYRQDGVTFRQDTPCAFVMGADDPEWRTFPPYATPGAPTPGH
ncbi:hypothetical protein [Streptomyces sp. NPDC097619]|uniref:hypothetical protein n=1 Tax=Streptomyces sp. NPDC097619 TaxID=3157228 RepID=UPI003328BCF5